MTCRLKLSALVLAICSALLLCAGVAGAQPPPRTAEDRAAAQSLFEAGKKLMEEKKLAPAAAKFEEAHRLYPSVGSLMNLARCYELMGKTASAWTSYSEAASLARSLNDHKRGRQARDLGAALQPKLSKITIEVPQATPGLKVLRDGVEVRAASFGVAIAVDPGEVVVEATAPGHQRWSRTVAVAADADHQKVEIPVLVPEQSTELPPPGDGAVVDEEAGISALVPVGFAIGGAGAIAWAVAGGISLSTRLSLDDKCADQICPPEQQEELDSGALASHFATAGVIVTGVGVALGIVGLAISDWGPAAAGPSAAHSGVELRPLLGLGRAAVQGRF